LVAEAPKEAERVRRVASVGRLWGSIQQYHPRLTGNSPEWDEALALAAEKIWNAPNNEVGVLAVDGLLATLKDPSTHRVQPKGRSLVNLPTAMKPFTWLGEGVLLVHLNDFARLWDRPQNATPVLLPEIEKAGTVIFDLRPLKQERKEQGMGASSWLVDGLFEILLPYLTDKPIHLPGERSRMSMGTPPPDNPTSSTYSAGVFIRQGQLIKPMASKAKRIVFLVNDESNVSSGVLALQHYGCARIVTEGDPTTDWSAEVEEASVFEDMKIEFRISEMVFSDGTTGAYPDDCVEASAYTDLRAPAVLKAMEVSKREAFSSRNSQQFGSSVPEASAVEQGTGGQFPDLGHRLLSAVKFWTAVNGFFAYPHLLDKPWDGVLQDQLPQFAQAVNALEYQQAVARFVACIQDSHGTVTKAFSTDTPLEIDKYLGDTALPVVVQVIEGKVAVTAIGDAALEQAGLKLGDVVLALDGENISTRMGRIRPFTAASTSQRMEHRVANRAMYGPKDQEAVLLVQRGEGKPIEVRFNRRSSQPTRISRRRGEVFRIMPGNIGYLDLDRIKPQDVNQAYDLLKNTRAVIFDMRGYPVAGAWMVPNRFVAKPNKVAATFREPVAMVRHGVGVVNWMEMNQKTTTIGNPPYTGKVVMLMDEGSQSSAEHMGLHLEAGNNATFIGSPTSGANGNITYVFLPGNLKTYFTGLDTRHGNGDQLQRKGLQPHVFVRPTIKGLADGRDEVLERAIQFVKEGH
jgi:C-terminal processing protease CtpA/Prc